MLRPRALAGVAILIAGGLVGLPGVGLPGASGAGVIPVPAVPPPAQSLAVTQHAVVWLDAGRILVVGGGGRVRTLAWLPPKQRESSGPSASSAEAAVMEIGDRVVAVWHGRVITLPPGRPSARGLCRGWIAAPSTPPRFFAVVGRYVVLDASGVPPCQAGSSPQPLYVHSLSGGRWRVLRWLAAASPPVLAAYGSLLAVGVQLSPHRMRVRLIDVDTGRLRGTLWLPDGYLQFAGPDRLVLSAAPANSFPVTPPDGSEGGLYVNPSGRYRLGLYSIRGRRLARLGSSATLPLVSGSHLVSVQPSRDNLTETVWLRALPSGSSRRVIAFRLPRRQLVRLAFRWPRLAMIEVDAVAQPDSCFDGGSMGPPFEQTLDLARPHAFATAYARPARFLLPGQPGSGAILCL